MRVVGDKLVLNEREQQIFWRAHELAEAIAERLEEQYASRGFTVIPHEASQIAVHMAVRRDYQNLDRTCRTLLSADGDYELPRDLSRQTDVLRCISLLARRISLAKVACATGLSLAWSSRMVNQLEAAGLVDVVRKTKNGTRRTPARCSAKATEKGYWAASDPRALQVAFYRLEERRDQ
jgi:hypothetical protein